MLKHVVLIAIFVHVLVALNWDSGGEARYRGEEFSNIFFSYFTRLKIVGLLIIISLALGCASQKRGAYLVDKGGVGNSVELKAAPYSETTEISLQQVYQITVLGEVNKAGTFNVFSPNFTILDALGLAGDLTGFGNRNIHIIRHQQGELQFHRLDITDRRAVASDFFYLKPNDTIYVEPLRSKKFGSTHFPVTLLLSLVSTTILVINLFK